MSLITNSWSIPGGLPMRINQGYCSLSRRLSTARDLEGRPYMDKTSTFTRVKISMCLHSGCESHGIRLLKPVRCRQQGLVLMMGLFRCRLGTTQHSKRSTQSSRRTTFSTLAHHSPQVFHRHSHFTIHSQAIPDAKNALPCSPNPGLCRLHGRRCDSWYFYKTLCLFQMCFY